MLPLISSACAAGVLQCAEKAVPWLDAMATARAGGAGAYARTIARCGRAGRIAFSMLGESCCNAQYEAATDMASGTNKLHNV